MLACYRIHTPYAAELHAIDLDLHYISTALISSTTWRTARLVVAADNQGALKSLAKPPPQRASLLTTLGILRKAKVIKQKWIQLRFSMGPPHVKEP